MIEYLYEYLSYGTFFNTHSKITCFHETFDTDYKISVSWEHFLKKFLRFNVSFHKNFTETGVILNETEVPTEFC